MVSKSTAKFIKSLQLKKYRKQEQCFLVEGKKSVLEVINSDYQIKQVVATNDFIDTHGNQLRDVEVLEAKESELSSLGSFKSNNMALAVVRMKNEEVEFKAKGEGYILALDDVNDPGNLGTILRVADWYGIKHIIASENTADLYNPKVISASKGSFLRVNVYYKDLMTVLPSLELPVYGALLNGENVHNKKFTTEGVLLMGSEANGISAKLLPFVSERITIPAFGEAESLNVAMATGIICDNIKRSLTTE